MKMLCLQSRRQFIKDTARFCGACSLMLPLNKIENRNIKNKNPVSSLTEARYYEKLPNRKIKCVLCPRECVIDDQETGYCGVRENYGGTYYTLVYGRITIVHSLWKESYRIRYCLPSSARTLK